MKRRSLKYIRTCFDRRRANRNLGELIISGKTSIEAYEAKVSPLNSSEIYVEDQEGRQKSVQELSRGTAEQLYLSLRFGFIREFGRHSESLPIVFDDVLVNFDPERCKSTCEAIKDLVPGNQLFYFTCHPETVEMLAGRFPEARVVDLDGV